MKKFAPASGSDAGGAVASISGLPGVRVAENVSRHCGLKVGAAPALETERITSAVAATAPSGPARSAFRNLTADYSQLRWSPGLDQPQPYACSAVAQVR
jgi:hypothetical protein